MKKVLLALVVVVGAVAMAAALWAVVAAQWPLAVLPRASAPVTAVPRSEARDGRILVRRTLEDEIVGPIRLTLSLPHPLPRERLPVILVLGGLGTGEENLRPVAAPGKNVLVGYDWPVPTRLPQGADLVLAAPHLVGRVLAVPGQLAAAIAWLARQPWADPDRVSVLGFSLGALAAPAALRIALAEGNGVAATVLAYGGAGLGTLVAGHPRFRPEAARPLAGAMTDLLLAPVEPARHLAHLRGPFLVIGGSDDAFVPSAAAERYHALLPEPKERVVLAGGHMGVGAGQEELLAEIIRISREWLVARGAVNAR